MNNIPLVDLKAQYKSIKKEIDQSIKSVLDKTNFIMGEEIKLFESDFAKFLGVKYAIGVSSGTDALHLALYALGIGFGDEVIVPTHTFTATAEVIVWRGAKPVFTETDEKTYTMETLGLEKNITNKTKAIIPVHLYGHPANMDKIMAISKKFGIPVIEDCAQAHGAEIKFKNQNSKIKMTNQNSKLNKTTIEQYNNITMKKKNEYRDDYHWQKVGGIGTLGCFSFYPGKNLGAYGDAGMVVTNSPKLAEKIYLLRNHGRFEKYTHQIVGFGNRLDTVQASVLKVKLKKLSLWNSLRRKNALIYSKFLNNISQVLVPIPANWAKHVYHLYVVRVKNRDKLREYLKAKSIETGIHYPIPLHLQPAYKYLGYKNRDFPLTQRIVKEIISLPLYPELKESQIRYICKCIKEFYS